MKVVLVIDIDEDFDYRRCSIGGDGNIYYERNGEQRTSIIGNIKNLKPMPEKLDNPYDAEQGGYLWKESFVVGYNQCLDDILGDK